MASKPAACAYHSKFLFEVQIPGLGSASFKKASELTMQVETEENREAGALLADKYPGTGSTEPLTLERGVTSDLGLIDWFKTIADFATGKGADACDDFKKTIVLIQKNRKQEEIRRYTIYGAWPSKITHGEWDNESTEKVVEKIEIVFDHYTVENK